MKIPKEFKLYNETIKVIIKDDLQLRDNKFGSAHYRYNEIWIDRNIINEEIIWGTFLHEMIHIILGKLYEYDLASNEKFVNGMSQLINQAFSTMIYKEKKNDDI